MCRCMKLRLRNFFLNERVKDERLLGHYKNVLHHGDEKIAPGPREALPVIKK